MVEPDVSFYELLCLGVPSIPLSTVEIYNYFEFLHFSMFVKCLYYWINTQLSNPNMVLYNFFIIKMLSILYDNISLMLGKISSI